MAADARAGRVNHRGLLFDDADTAASGPSGLSIDFFVGNSSSAVALRFRECRFRILRQFNRDARRCLVAHCGVDVAREWWDTGDVIDPGVFDDSEGSALDRPGAPPRLDQNFHPPDRPPAGEETTADRLCRTHSQTLTQLARDAPASLKASSGLLARKQLLLGRLPSDEEEEGHRIEPHAARQPDRAEAAQRPSHRGARALVLGQLLPHGASAEARADAGGKASARRRNRTVGEAGCGLVRQRARAEVEAADGADHEGGLRRGRGGGRARGGGRRVRGPMYIVYATYFMMTYYFFQ